MSRCGGNGNGDNFDDNDNGTHLSLFDLFLGTVIGSGQSSPKNYKYITTQLYPVDHYEEGSFASTPDLRAHYRTPNKEFAAVGGVTFSFKSVTVRKDVSEIEVTNVGNATVGLHLNSVLVDISGDVETTSVGVTPASINLTLATVRLDINTDPEVTEVGNTEVNITIT